MQSSKCAEEFLFRGALYALAARAFGDRSIARLPMPVLYSSVFFSLQHLQYHALELTPPAVTQLVYTFFMGLFFGLVRFHGRSIWPVIGVHMLNNSFMLIRNFG